MSKKKKQPRRSRAAALVPTPPTGAPPTPPPGAPTQPFFVKLTFAVPDHWTIGKFPPGVVPEGQQWYSHVIACVHLPVRSYYSPELLTEHLSPIVKELHQDINTEVFLEWFLPVPQASTALHEELNPQFSVQPAATALHGPGWVPQGEEEEVPLFTLQQGRFRLGMPALRLVWSRPDKT